MYMTTNIAVAAKGLKREQIAAYFKACHCPTKA
jgi:hypothetical protein